MTKQIRIRFGGKARPTEVGTERIGRLDEEIREKMELGERAEICMVSEARQTSLVKQVGEKKLAGRCQTEC